MAATIKDVAKLAETSTATVSKVMNGSYSISKETIKRVEWAMKELNYHPNMRARNFVRQSTRSVIFVTSLGRDAGFSNPHMFEIMAGLEEALSEKEYALGIKSLSKRDAIDYVKYVVDTKLADGLVIHASVISKELDMLVEEYKIPHIVIGMPDFQNHFCWIDIDNRLAGEMAAK